MTRNADFDSEDVNDSLDEDDLVESLAAESEHTMDLSRLFYDAIQHGPARMNLYHLRNIVQAGAEAEGVEVKTGT